MKSASRRITLPIVALAIIGIALTGCSSASPAGDTVGTADGVVTVEGPLIGTDAARLEKSWASWEKANHIQIKYTGSTSFQQDIGGEAQQGNAPDLGIFVQPGLLNDLASRGYVRKLPADVQSEVNATFPADWVKYTTTGGNDYAAPLLANLNGWIFYSPAEFDKLNIKVPTTWSELLTVSEYIRADTSTPPWCEGFSAGAASGTAGTTWIEDMVLRDDGPAVYDQWVSHKIPFSDPRIQQAFTNVGQVLQNRSWVNGTFGTAASINTTTTAQVAKAMESGQCLLTHQSSSFLNDLSTTSNGVEVVSPQGEMWAFILPPVKPGPTPFTQSGDFVAAFSNDADTVKVQKYLASAAWGKKRMALGGAISPAKSIIASDTPDELLRSSVTLMQSSSAAVKFDAGDLMPSVVGEGTFLSGMVNWIKGASTKSVTSTIDGSWPDN
jgi:alpha-glucoside transport system substrate-binding protein